MLKDMERKEAIEVIKKNYPDSSFTMLREALETLIPELKESEDESIRKGIIEYLEKSQFGEEHYQIDDDVVRSYIAWLEKQGNQKEINLVEILKHYPRETELYSPIYGKLWLAEADERNETITCYKHRLDEGCTRAILEQEDTVSFYSNGTTGLPDFSISKDCMLFLYDIEKQGKTMKVKSEIVKDYIGEENVWNNDCEFRPEHMKRCLCYDKYMGGVYCYVYDDISKYWCTQTTEEHDPDGDNHICDYGDYRVTAWMSLPKTPFYSEKQDKKKETLCEKCRKDHSSHSCQDITELGRCALEHQSEQKSDDNFEPEFKIDDWITNGIETVQITGYDIDYGYQVDYKGNLQHRDTDIIEKEYHLWTVQDAKDGDVLYCKKRVLDNSEIIMMYAGISNGVDSYCRYSSKFGFNMYITNVLNVEHDFITPATKEQRELLFTKMKEAGYGWDAEKKELIKIENVPAWSEEDENRIMKELLYNVIVSNDNTPSTKEIFSIYGKTKEDALSWLEKQAEQSYWKPSEEQMQFLHAQLNEGAVTYPEDKRVLTTLYENLMKIN